MSRYPEVKIEAPEVICVVTFNTNDLDMPAVINVAQGTIIGEIPTPVKPSTQAHYYVFENWTYNNGESIWTPETIIQSDLVITAQYSEHLQKYHVEFDTDSEIISVDDEHKAMIIEYGSEITRPELINVPTGVTLEGWYKPDGTQWVFEGELADKVRDNIKLTAKWHDGNTPNVNAVPLKYNTFKYTAEDNLGITAWAVVKDSAEQPTIWNEIESTISFEGTHTITEAGEYYFWVKDRFGNTESQKVIAYSINVSTTHDTISYNFSTVENENINTTFAFTGTPLTLNVSMDEAHYENLRININGSSSVEFIVTQPIQIELSCKPKDFEVYFNLGGKGEAIKAPTQTITYLHLVKKPLAQYWQHSGEVIEGWYKEPECINSWKFETDKVENEMTLYAKWAYYRKPTIATIEIPEGDESVRTVTLSYSQAGIDANHKVNIIWDWSEETTEINGETSDIADTTINISYTYAKAGTYKIAIYGPGYPATYGLGNNTTCFISPSNYLTAVDLAWDIPILKNYIFENSSLTSCCISEYLTAISIGCYTGCKNITSVEIPTNITSVGTAAFRNCTGITEIKLHDNLEISNSMFNGCESLTEVITNTKSIGKQAFANCTRLEKVVLTNKELSMTEGGSIFDNCTKLNSVAPIGYLDSSGNEADIQYAWTTKIPDNAFWQGFNEGTITEVILPEDLEEIGANAFCQTRITSIKLPNKLKVIGEAAFANCKQLQGIEIPASVTDIRGRCFNGCGALISDGVVIKALSSSTLVEDPEQAWFYATNPNLPLQVSKDLYTNGDDPRNYYGTYWNVYLKPAEGDIIFLDVEGIDINN